MEKGDLYLQVTESDSGICPINVTAWLDDEREVMLDEHLTELFPELEDVGLMDLCEGEMEFDGELNVAQLSNLLERMGFNVLQFA